ncbi:MAG: hypothetical protein JW795_03880, partial [Chitinivibrionales bacterium]|nr:hypothetical protein [Chitinivibrionales bacterium]
SSPLLIRLLCLMIPLFLLIPEIQSAAATKKTERLEISFFGSPTCGECQEIKVMILQPMEKQYSDRLKIDFFNIEDSAGFNRQIAMEKLYNVQSPSPQELYLPDTVLLGYDAIIQSGQQLIEWYLTQPQLWHIRVDETTTGTDSISYQKSLQQRFEKFTFLGIVAAGLIDSINPCAIATLIFLISFLAVRRKSKQEILVIGTCFTASVFFTYLLVGIGLFKVLVAVKSYFWLSRFIRWSAVAFAGGVAVLSFIDAFRYKKSGKSNDIINQLPKPIKLKIHRIISANLSGTKLAIGSMVTGFLVTLLEGVCTGQVYVPTIILMTRQEGMRFIGWLYLILYNLLFIVPLVIIMALAYFGLRWEKLAKAAQSNMVIIKILFGIVLAALAVFLATAG